MTVDDARPGLRHRQTIAVNEALTVPAVSAAFTGFPDIIDSDKVLERVRLKGIGNSRGP